MRRPGLGRRIPHRAVVLIAIVAGASIAVTAPVSAQPPAGTAFTEATSAAQQVSLITGDEVTVFPRPGGSTGFALAPANRQPVQSFQADGGHRYVIPAVALPYLGKLDRSLFDVTAPAKQNSGRIGLELSFPEGAAPAALPGITLTSRSGNTATGYFTPESATAFGAELHRRIVADVAAGRPAGSSGLPVTIRAAGAAQQVPEQPRYPMHDLELGLKDLDGKPVNGSISLIDTDSASRANLSVDVEGVARVAVPAGHYAAYSTFVDWDADGNVKAIRTVAVEGFAVDDSAATATLTVDERTATAPIRVSSPKPAAQQQLQTSVYREDPTGRGLGLIVVGPETPQYVSPVAKPSSGRLHYVVQWGGAPPKAEDRYRVDLSFAAEGIPADQSFATKESELATVRDVLHADPADTMPVAIDNGPVDPVIERHGFGASGFYLPAPGTLIDYLGTTHTSQWGQEEVKSSSRQLMLADPRRYPAGSTTTTDWSRGPLSSGLGQWNRQQTCEACYSGSTVSLAIPALRDSMPDHTALPLFYAPKVHYSLYQDDKQVFDQDGATGAVVEAPKTPAVFRGVLDVDRTAVPGVSQAGKIRTELSVRYDPAAENPVLPAPHVCQPADSAQPCRILGALTVDYRLDADLTTTSKVGGQALALHVGHAAFSGAGSRSPVTSAAVSVSFDDGATWQPAKVTGTPGDYRATWENPPESAGKSPSLKVTAQDRAGDAITQTITGAYTVAKAGA
ncbi:hypothetical protein GCM10022222_01920 [Amycolatopsis ultiminotia]|uniref:Uncharacterized protein n=1 Tax=Amycolatopsis ultiminotia TaxID=543629 RepID=A0ABP6UYV2_9PSEU